MDQLEITSVEGRKLTLSHNEAEHDEDRRFTAALEFEAGRVQIEVIDMGNGLVDFFQLLTEDWRGFDGVESYRALEGQLELAARHDGHGSINFTALLMQPVPPTWSTQCELTIGAGAHAESIADGVRQLFRCRP